MTHIPCTIIQMLCSKNNNFKGAQVNIFILEIDQRTEVICLTHLQKSIWSFPAALHSLASFSS